MKIKHTTLVWIHRGSKCSFQFSSSMKIKNWKTDKKLPAGGGTRCVYLSSIRFSSIIENWKLKSISVHLDWFHLKQNVKKKNQNWNKHFWSLHLRKNRFQGANLIIFYHFLLRHKIKSCFPFSLFLLSSEPNLEITALT